METIILQFEKVTGYPLLDYMTKSRDFLVNSYPRLEEYFSGSVGNIDSYHIQYMKDTKKETEKILNFFQTSRNKFSNCGFWELMDFVSEIESTLEKISKLPKYRRTSLTKMGYRPFVQVDGSIGALRTPEELASHISGEESWSEIMLGNDLNETDWEIDKFKNVDIFIENNILPVETILDRPEGDKVYGIDMDRKIGFEENDLSLKVFKENIAQKIDILLALNKGDIPEEPNLGKNLELYSGSTIKNFLFPELSKELINTFLQNDLFENVEIQNVEFQDSELLTTVNVKTRYDYQTVRQAII